MNDQDFIDHFEHEVRSRFFAPFDGRNFFNDSLFNYILDTAGEDPDKLGDRIQEFSHHLGARFGHTTHELMMVVDQRCPSVAFEVSTPTTSWRFVVEKGELHSEEMAPAA